MTACGCRRESASGWRARLANRAVADPDIAPHDVKRRLPGHVGPGSRSNLVDLGSSVQNPWRMRLDLPNGGRLTAGMRIAPGGSGWSADGWQRQLRWRVAHAEVTARRVR